MCDAALIVAELALDPAHWDEWSKLAKGRHERKDHRAAGAEQATTSPAFLNVQVPPGAVPGTIVAVSDASGMAYNVAVPPGAAPGTIFQCQVAAQQQRTEKEVSSAMARWGVAGSVGKAAMGATVSVSKAAGSAVLSGAQYVHEKGWDRKAAGAAASASKAAAKATGRSLLAAGKGLYDKAKERATSAGECASAGGDRASAADSSAAADRASAAGEAANGSNAESIFVVVPPGAQSGSPLSIVTPWGQQMLLTVPEGAGPGMQIQVNVRVQ